MIYHIVVGDAAAAPLQEAIRAEASMEGELIVLKDILHLGPLERAEGQSFSELRSQFWNTVAPNEKTPVQVDDLERLLGAANELASNGEAKLWFWMAPAAADVCGYYWVL